MLKTISKHRVLTRADKRRNEKNYLNTSIQEYFIQITTKGKVKEKERIDMKSYMNISKTDEMRVKTVNDKVIQVEEKINQDL